MIFSLGKIVLSDIEIIPFEHHNATWHVKTGTNDVTLQYVTVQITSFSDVRKAKNGQFHKM